MSSQSRRNSPYAALTEIQRRERLTRSAGTKTAVYRSIATKRRRRSARPARCSKAALALEAVLLPRDIADLSGSLDIRIEKSLAGVTNESLTYLERATRRHRECATTIVSRFLPNIVTYRALNELGLAKPDLKAKLD